MRGQSSYKDLTQTSNSLMCRWRAWCKGARVVATYPRGNTYATELELDTRNLYHPEPADGGPVLGRVRGRRHEPGDHHGTDKGERRLAFCLVGEGPDLGE